MAKYKTTKSSTLNSDKQKARDLFETWLQYEMTGKPMKELDEDFKRRSLSYSAINLKKEQFGLKVEVPSILYVMFCFLTEDNPGKTVMIFKISYRAFMIPNILLGYHMVISSKQRILSVLLGCHSPGSLTLKWMRNTIRDGLLRSATVSFLSCRTTSVITRRIGKD